MYFKSVASRELHSAAVGIITPFIALLRKANSSETSEAVIGPSIWPGGVVNHPCTLQRVSVFVN